MSEIKRSYTREELYELVWSTPMLRLAAKFGISDRALAKTCTKHLIPLPPRGYWAKLEAGQTVAKTKLRSVENKDLHNLYIGRSQIQLSERARQAVAATKIQRAEIERLQKSQPEIEMTHRSSSSGMTESVTQKTIAAMVKQLSKSKPNEEGVIQGPGIAVHERSRDRAVGVLHSLAIAC